MTSEEKGNGTRNQKGSRSDEGLFHIRNRGTTSGKKHYLTMTNTTTYTNPNPSSPSSNTAATDNEEDGMAVTGAIICNLHHHNFHNNDKPEDDSLFRVRIRVGTFPTRPETHGGSSLWVERIKFEGRAKWARRLGIRQKRMCFAIFCVWLHWKGFGDIVSTGWIIRDSWISVCGLLHSAPIILVHICLHRAKMDIQSANVRYGI